MFKLNKKAGLEIGINTIVILVIAMVVIGGGIAFIRTFFKLGEDKLKEPFELADFGLKPSSSEPLVLQAGTININLNEEKVIKGGFFNKDSANSITINRITIEECIGSSTDNSFTFKHKSIPFTVPPNSEAGFNLLIVGQIEGTGTLSTGTYICNVKAEGTGISTPITIKVGN